MTSSDFVYIFRIITLILKYLRFMQIFETSRLSFGVADLSHRYLLAGRGRFLLVRNADRI